MKTSVRGRWQKSERMVYRGPIQDRIRSQSGARMLGGALEIQA